jgi:hypothetical protein
MVKDYLQALHDAGYIVTIKPDWLMPGQTYVGIEKPSKRVEAFVAGKSVVKKLIKQVYEKVEA